MNKLLKPSDNTAYTLQAYALVLWDMGFGNVVYAGTVMRQAGECSQ
jgi:hypothetical protein